MKRGGFTLLEVLTVILIFGVLVSLSGFVYSSALARSRDNQRKSDLQTIKNSLEQFYLDNKAYPGFDIAGDVPIFLAKWQLEKGLPTNGCSQVANKKFLTPSYINSVPEDPQKKLDPTQNCNALSSQISEKRQYLYFSLPIPAPAGGVSRQGYYLIAQVERESNFSELTILSGTTNKLGDAGYINNLNLPTFSNSLTEYNYVVSSSRNN